LPIFACHSRGPVWCTDVPSLDTAHRHRHVLDVELVDRLHAEVGEGKHLAALIALATR